MKEKIKEKKQLMLLVVGCFFVGMSFFCWRQEPEDLTKEDFIRFHVIANSNKMEDQVLKLQVRDAVLEQIAPELAQMDSLEHTRAYILGNMEKIADIAEDVMAKEGFFYGADAELGVRWIPEKTYGQVTFPGGTYEAFTLTLGEGEGENWWCVMFPPLCLIDETTEKDGEEEWKTQEKEPKDWIAEKYEPLIESQEKGKPLVLKFKTAELFGAFFGKIPEK